MSAPQPSRNPLAVASLLIGTAGLPFGGLFGAGAIAAIALGVAALTKNAGRPGSELAWAGILTAVLSLAAGAPLVATWGALEGPVPWGPATEQRFPVIDPERGIVLGITLLHYQERPNQPRMYVSEVFKVVGGKIVAIDNIGLMLEGVAHLGFAH